MNRLLNSLARIGLPAIGAAAFFVAAPAPLPAAEAPAAAPADLVAAVAALRAVTTLRADFVQTDRNGQRVSGVLTMKRPGKIRFQYEKGVPLLIVGDGKALTFIDSGVRPPQIQRWPIGNSPLGALLDPGRDVSRFGHLQPSFDRGIVSIEVRDPRHPEYGVITLFFARKPGAPGGMELTAWIALDSQNQRTTIRLSGQQYGMDLADSQFRVLDTSIRPHK